VNAKKTLVGCLFLCLGLAARSDAQTVTLQAVADASLRQGSANQNRGGDPTLQLAGDGRVLLRFDQAAIAAAVGSGRLVSASLELFVHSASGSWGSGGRPIEAHRATADWTEAGVTWNCAVDTNPANGKPDCATRWDGGTFDDDASDSILETSADHVWLPFDVTADVATFLTGTPNQGWLIVKADDDQSGKADYGSREGIAAERPRLVLLVESAAHDSVPPSLAITSPDQPILVNQPAPTVVVEYADGGSGVDLATLQVLVDGQDITASCATGPQSATCHAPTLAAGSHAVQARLKDRAGNAAQASAAFQLLLGPGPHLVTFQTVGDTYIRKGDANKNFGAEPILRLRQSGQNRALVQFDSQSLATALTGATVVSASLELHIKKNGRNWGKTGRTIDAHRLTTAWTETGATWNCANDANPTNGSPDCAAQWAGGGFAATPTASVLHTRDLAGWVRYDVTADVAAFTRGTADFGWLLKKTEENKSGLVEYDSRQGTTGNAPRLVVVFTTPSGGGDTTLPTVAITAPAEGSFVASPTPTVVATYSDTGSGVDPASVRLVVDGVDRTAQAQVTVSGLTFTPAAPLAEGAHTSQVTVKDRAGNAAQATRGFTTDTVAPVVGLTLPAYAKALPLVVNGTVSDTDPAVQVVVNGAPATVTGSTFQAALVLLEGANPVSVIAMDRAGHQGTASGSVILDQRPPALRLETPSPNQVFNRPAARVAGTVSDENGIATLQVNGVAVSPAADGGFETSVPLSEGAQTITVAATDVAGNRRALDVAVTRLTLPEVTITAPADLGTLAATTVMVRGAVSSPGLAVAVNGLRATVSGTDFSVEIPLVEGGNIITAVATAADGRSGSATINVVRDLTPPHLSIDQPRAGASVRAAAVTVAGLVNDIVAGTVNAPQAQVKVNGRPARVANRSFLVEGVPLQAGDNTLTAEAVDASGNVAQVSIVVRRETGASARLVAVSGDGQQGVIGMALPAPLVAVAQDTAGLPAVGTTVVFEVRGNDGSLDGGRRRLAVVTDSAGRAAVHFTLGTRAGVGNQVVVASAAGYGEPVAFLASALAGEPAAIVVDAGDQQVGVAGQPLPRPLIAVVTDSGHNRLPAIAVHFSVVNGAGRLPNGLDQMVIATDGDGRAITPFTLDPQEGVANNTVVARIEGLPNGPLASFTASGLSAGDPARTSISGIVLDNQNDPIPGVTIRILDTSLTAQTDARGAFRISGAPVGTVRMLVDGSTAARPGSWPDLEYTVTTIPGRDVTVNMPIFLLPLDLAHGLAVDETHGGTLTLPDLPGFALVIAPGSVTFPGGSRSGVVSVTAVHSDKVPMVPNFGQQPRFIVTIQPAGARFEPPARLSLPNVEGLAPGQVTEMYSFDHDLGHFVSIGPATVSDDGSTMVANPGVGIVKAGWHCGGSSSSSGTPHHCADCQKCENDCCVPDPAKNNQGCDDKDKCTVDDKCNNGNCKGQTVKVTITRAPSFICAGNSKPVAATITPASRTITWKSLQPANLTVSGGTSGTATGVKKGSATIQASDSQTDCNQDSRSIRVVDMSDFNGMFGEKSWCVASLGNPLAVAACARARQIAGQVVAWQLRTFHGACAKINGDPEGTMADAGRHAYLSCALHSDSLTSLYADTILNLHEQDASQDCLSHEQDVNNNEVGKSNASSGVDCAQAALQSLAAGRLQINNPPPAGTSCP